mgnify:CR=1 FL=1
MKSERGWAKYLSLKAIHQLVRLGKIREKREIEIKREKESFVLMGLKEIQEIEDKGGNSKLDQEIQQIEDFR